MGHTKNNILKKDNGWRIRTWKSLPVMSRASTYPPTCCIASWLEIRLQTDLMITPNSISWWISLQPTGILTTEEKKNKLKSLIVLYWFLFDWRKFEWKTIRSKVDSKKLRFEKWGRFIQRVIFPYPASQTYLACSYLKSNSSLPIKKSPNKEGQIWFNFSSNLFRCGNLLNETLEVTIKTISKVIDCLLSEQTTDLDLTSVGEIWGGRFHEQDRFGRNRILQLGSMLTSWNKTIEKKKWKQYRIVLS